MKNIVILILKIIFIVALTGWFLLVIVDYTRAKDATKPLFCISEKTSELEIGKYYECKSIGYKYFELQKPNQTKDYGLVSIFQKNPLEKRYGVSNEE